MKHEYHPPIVEPMSQEDLLSTEAPLAVLVCIVYILIALGIHHFKKVHRYAPWIHESSISCLFGLIIGSVIKYLTHKSIKFSNGLFFYLILPPIIFSAGYSLKRKRFFQHFHQIVFFGVVGTIINFLMIACGAYYYKKIIGDFDDYSLSWNESFLFSSILSGSDEVSAMSIIPIRDFPRMGALIFGEGVINDALSIVLFETFLPICSKKPTNDVELLQIPSISLVSQSITIQIIFSVTIGSLCALTISRILKYFSWMRHYPIYQSALIMLFGYLSYCLAEVFEVSGILTLFICAIVQSHYTWHSLSRSAQIATRVSFAAISDIAEGFAFSYVGLSLWGYARHEINITFTVYMLFIMLFSRFFSIFLLFFICKQFFPSYDIPITEQIGFILGGVVRGCLCWAQVLQVRDSPVMVTTALLIVLTTLLSSGVLLPMILGPMINAKISSQHYSSIPTENPIEPYDPQRHYPRHGSGRPIKQTLFSPVKQSPLPIHPVDISQPSIRYLSNFHDLSRTNPDHSKISLDQSTWSSADLASYGLVKWIKFDEDFMKPYFGGSKTDDRRKQLLNETKNISVMALIQGKINDFSGYFGARNFEEEDSNQEGSIDDLLDTEGFEDDVYSHRQPFRDYTQISDDLMLDTSQNQMFEMSSFHHNSPPPNIQEQDHLIQRNNHNYHSYQSNYQSTHPLSQVSPMKRDQGKEQIGLLPDFESISPIK